jgi:ABC-type cobalamin transport system ATPase subunit
LPDFTYLSQPNSGLPDLLLREPEESLKKKYDFILPRTCYDICQQGISIVATSNKKIENYNSTEIFYMYYSNAILTYINYRSIIVSHEQKHY